MQIKSSNIQMNSNHQTTIRHSKTERLNMWIDTPQTSPTHSQVSISPEALQKSSETINAAEDESVVIPGNIQILKLMLEKMFNKEFELFDANTLKTKIDNINHQPVNENNVTTAQNQGAGYGVEYDFQESYQESEITTFHAAGEIRSTSGQQFNFSVELNMSRQYLETSEIHIREGDAKLVDPLVINLSDTAAQLSHKKFAFDLNADGKKEDISHLISSSGFIALDKNDDGQINDGSELFGAITGDGFSELSKFDDDNNRFIDSGDAIFDKLKIWQLDENGESKYFTLAELDIAAIYLDKINTEFNINTAGNQTLGKIQSTSLYFKNSGEAGTVQKLDFVV